MSGFTCSIDVDAPQERVFEVFTDFERAAEHMDGIERLEVLTETPVGVGTRFRETRIFYGREATEEIEITTFDPPNRYVAEAHSHGAEFRSEFRFEALAAGGTRVEVTFGAMPVSFLARILAFLSRLMLKGVQECTQQDLVDLKAVAERP
ncbi:MAG: SRPBCC family protein [Pseudomonadota bacterium]